MFFDLRAISHPRAFAFGIIIVCATSLTGMSQSQELRFSSDQDALLDILQSDIAAFEKAKACQRLAEIGDARAVGTLAKLLSDEQLSNYARHALEGIRDPKASDALRESLGQLKGDLLKGVIGSIGRRRDVQAVEPLASLLNDLDEGIVDASARALAQIGNARSAELLITALTPPAAKHRNRFAAACLISAERLMESGDKATAGRMLDLIKSGDFGSLSTRAAAYESVLDSEGQSFPILIEQLSSPDYATFAVSLHALMRIEGNSADTLVSVLERIPEERQALVLSAIGQMRIAKVPAKIAILAREGSSAIRAEALRVLGSHFDTAFADTLFAAATDSDQQVATAAREAIESVSNTQLDDRIVAMFKQKNKNEVIAAIDLCARRRIEKSANQLLQLTLSSDQELRLFAILALGSTCSLEQLPSLIAISLDSSKQDEMAAAREALKIACIRLPQNDCTEAIHSSAMKTSGEAQAYLLEQLVNIGGDRALAALADAARSSNSLLQDTGTRLLGEWLSADAAPTLLELSKSLTDGRLQTRALRGYIRIARQLDMPLEDRMTVCKNSLEIAQRADERSLVLEVLKQYPATTGLLLASTLVDDPAVCELACTTVVTIVKRISGRSPKETRGALEKVLKATQVTQTAAEARALLQQ